MFDTRRSWQQGQQHQKKLRPQEHWFCHIVSVAAGIENTEAKLKGTVPKLLSAHQNTVFESHSFCALVPHAP